MMSVSSCQPVDVARRLLCVGLLLSVACIPAQSVSAENTSKAKHVAQTHWAFQPPTQPQPPKLSEADAEWARNPIDAFILAQLRQRKLWPMTEAHRLTLIRRVTFDLTGLPPTPAEVDAFIHDRSDDAYEKLVDRLLKSSAYGERWAQHWLDLARFAETDGFEHDKTRPDAWRYRDWVVQALNNDMPFDRFVRLQIAGDEIEPGDENAAIATGFLLAGQDMPDINDQNERKHVKLNEMTSTVGAAFMGLTLECAACHDHKYDPVTQRDFYALRAFFANTVHTRRDKALGHRVKEPGASVKPHHVMVRGDFRRPGDVVQPAFLPIADHDNQPIAPPPDGAASSMRRKALAHWLTRPDHPLTARVIVNRLWQHHFGRPLVATPSDFGKIGARPTHPLLLDWLAAALVDRGWSLKQMHRLMVTSATYRQASRLGQLSPKARYAVEPRYTRAQQNDPNNVLLWRMNRKRLDGEAIRDAMLQAAGRLNRKTGGPGVMAPLPKEVLATLLRKQWTVNKDKSEHDRRSIYLFVRRNLRFPMFEAFDRPDGHTSCARRARSTTAPQALILINSAFSLEMARSLAGRVMRETGNDTDARIAAVYQFTLGHKPPDDQVELVTRYLSAQSSHLKQTKRTRDTLALPDPMPDNIDPHEAAAFVDLCLLLFNLNEFVYLD